MVDKIDLISIYKIEHLISPLKASASPTYQGSSLETPYLSSDEVIQDFGFKPYVV